MPLKENIYIDYMKLKEFLLDLWAFLSTFICEKYKRINDTIALIKLSHINSKTNFTV